MKKHFYIVIADVHGEAEELKLALAKSRLYVGDNEYTIVFTGDLIDRGGHENEVLTIVKEEVEKGAVLLLGNHDYFLVGTGNGDPKQARTWDINDGWATCIRMFGLVEQKTKFDLLPFREWMQARGFNPYMIDQACLRTTMSWEETIKNSWQYALLSQSRLEWNTKRIYFCHAPQIDVKEEKSLMDLTWGDWDTYEKKGQDDRIFRVPGPYGFSVHGHIHKLGSDVFFPRLNVYQHGGTSKTVILADSGCGCGSSRLRGELHPIILSENEITTKLEAIL
jgi:calcineurin-like phosphoesterase family protein